MDTSSAFGGFQPSPPPPTFGDAQALVPTDFTFRRSAERAYTSKLDGTVLSPILASGASITCPAINHDAQHRPVLLTLRAEALSHSFLRWVHPEPSQAKWGSHDLEPGLQRSFDEAIRDDINTAWRIWHLGAGGADLHSTVREDAHWGRGR